MKLYHSSMFGEIVEKLLDIFFPPTYTEKLLRKIKIWDVYNKCQKTNGINDTNIISIFSYKDPFIRDSIIELKTNKNKYAIDLFAEILKQEIYIFLQENLINPDKKIVFSYIPQHTDVYLNKGFNQTEELAKKISEEDKNFELIECLIKIKKTKPQRETKSRKERLKNIKNSFEIVNKKNLKDRTVILIDDVVTTGATLNEARRILLVSGVQHIYCFTIAH